MFMETETQSVLPKAKPGRVRSRIMAGLALVIPIWITTTLAMIVFRLMRDASLWLVEAWLAGYGEQVLQRWKLTPEIIAAQGIDAFPLSIRVVISILAVILTVLILYALGTITTHVLFKRLVVLGERVVHRVPLIGIVYQASKQVVETFASEGGQAFRKVVLVPYPHPGMLTFGFVTNETTSLVTGERLYSVFVPTVPNPTTGFVFVVRTTDVHELDWPVEEAIKVIMSGGVMMPAKISRFLELAAAATNDSRTKPKDVIAGSSHEL